METPLDLRHIVGLNKENAWSDLLATFIEADPTAFLDQLGEPVGGLVTVRREFSVDRADRVDLVILVDGTPWAVIEAKVLAGVGANQLRRYRAAVPGAQHFRILYSRALGMDAPHEGWGILWWEDLLEAYATSSNQWVATTADAWLHHLADVVPAVDASTRWNNMRGELVPGLRARMNWVREQLTVPEGARKDLVTAGGGRSPVARLLIDSAHHPGYTFIVEVQEGLSQMRFSTATPADLKGPVAKVFALQRDVSDSRSYNWDLLHSMWKLIEPSSAALGRPWVTRRATPKAAHDRENQRRLIAKGMPAYVGFGYGDAQARITRDVIFGARMALPADVSLGDLVATLDELGKVLPALRGIA
jgi:hypothetical protein